MIKGFKLVLSLIVCLVFVGSLGPLTKAQASPAMPPQPQADLLKSAADTVTVQASLEPRTAASTQQGYTLEQRRSAKSLDIKMSSSDLSGGSTSFSGGTPGLKTGSLPDPQAQAKARAAFPDAWTALDNRASLDQPSRKTVDPMSLYGTKNVFAGYLGNYFSPFYLNYPYSTVGKLYFQDAYSYYSCTATLIGEWTIVTAAHCVYDTDYNYWYYGWQFVPAEMDLAEPYGYYNYYNATVLVNWMKAKKSSSGMRYDVAVISTYGYPGDEAGWVGYGWNWPAKQEIHAIGYPSNITGGYYTYICAAEGFQKSSDVLGMGCDMTYGSSGGPWFMWFMPYQDYYPYSQAGNIIIGTVSGGNPSYPTFYGPRFSSKNIYLLCYATGCY